MAFKIRGQDREINTELWLHQESNGTIILKAARGDDSSSLIVFEQDGSASKCTSINPKLGFILNTDRSLYIK